MRDEETGVVDIQSQDAVECSIEAPASDSFDEKADEGDTFEDENRVAVEDGDAVKWATSVVHNEPTSPSYMRRTSSVVSVSKFESYDLKVDPSQGDRASEIKLCTFKRPHMRAFHFAWWCYHVAFLMWFSISPLLSEVQKSLDLTKEQVWTSSIAAVTGTIIMRFALGPFCDKYGPRIPMGVILMCSAIPTGLTGLAKTATGLSVMRFFIGVGGSTFVMCQYWTTRMFTKEWAGTANATVGGWGNLGGGVTQLLMGSFLFPVLTKAYNGDTEKAWRTACVVPATIGIITSVCVIKFTDDSPHGNYSKMKKTNQMQDVSAAKSFRKGVFNLNTWLVFIQYACCFGVEITMNNAAALYFKETFFLSTESAAAVASIFGWMNIFARGTGGFLSDKANAKRGMQGRLAFQSTVLLLEGCMVVTFAYITNLGAAIAVLVFFSIFVQMAEGSSYGIVPYIDPPFTGSISGIIGAGGNVGSFAFSFCFRQMSFKNAYITMGFIILSSSVLSVFVRIKGHPVLLCNKREPDTSNEKAEEDTDLSANGSHDDSIHHGDSDISEEEC